MLGRARTEDGDDDEKEGGDHVGDVDAALVVAVAAVLYTRVSGEIKRLVDRLASRTETDRSIGEEEVVLCTRDQGEV